MLKFKLQQPLTFILLTGTMTTVALLSSSMVEKASAITLVPNTTCSVANLTTSSQCSGIYSGNDSNQDVTGLFSPPNYGWTEVAKAEGPENGSPWTNNGLTVMFNNAQRTSGTWSYTNPSQSLNPFMFILKGGPTFSAYLIPSGVTSGTWNTQDLLTGGNNPQRGPGLSHFSVYKDPTPVPIESDALPVLGATIFFGSGMWLKQRRRKARLTLKDSPPNNANHKQVLISPLATITKDKKNQDQATSITQS